MSLLVRHRAIYNNVADETGEIETPFVRSAFNYDADYHSELSGTDASVAHMEAHRDTEKVRCAQQQFKDECDINVLVERYGITGELPVGDRRPIDAADFTEVTDYQTALNQLITAQNAFMDLPAKVRKEFDNDPAKLLEFLNDSNNKDEAIRLGIIAAPPEIPSSGREESTSKPA